MQRNFKECGDVGLLVVPLKFLKIHQFALGSNNEAVQNFLSLKCFQPEVVVHEVFFAAARKAEAARCQDYSVFVQLRGDPMQSQPVLALCRVLTGIESMTLPGFFPDTSVAVLAGVRQLMRESGSFA
jgi:hypothetical protein